MSQFSWQAKGSRDGNGEGSSENKYQRRGQSADAVDELKITLLVEVPMVVDMPPIIVARPIGSMTPETGNLTRKDTPTRIGISRTTIGVLFMNALSIAPATSVTNSASDGRLCHALLTIEASGCSAPVVSSALPTIINAQIAISASLPKPAKKSEAPISTPFLS